ncbi:PREDICTED: uncharacterized protein LOC109353906, partial [Lupinus angustifolius]|uniref:uncharacterized protein LOC109353906 n=1 Tax=Lupinus angustifolius TaxID=3871 RepID=UPI00092F0F8E
MAESVKPNNLQNTLKHFYQSFRSRVRIYQIKERLSRLEDALINKKDTGNEEHLKVVNDLQSKLKDATVDLISEKRRF